MKKYTPVLALLIVATLTFLNFYRFCLDQNSIKAYLYDKYDCISWCLVLGYFFISRKVNNWHVDVVINSVFLFNMAGAAIWFMKTYFFHTTIKYKTDWQIGGFFALLAVGNIILNFAYQPTNNRKRWIKNRQQNNTKRQKNPS